MTATRGISSRKTPAERSAAVRNSADTCGNRFRDELRISHHKLGDTREIRMGSPLVYPKFSILDPVNTFTVPKDHTIYGMVDMMSHVFEQYFHHTSNTPYQDRMCESLLRTVIETAPKLINDLENYELRETILYTGTIALNGMLSMGARGIGPHTTSSMRYQRFMIYRTPEV